MKHILPAFAIVLALWSPEAEAASVWTCQVAHSYDLASGGEHARGDKSYIGDRFTANDGTGEVAGPHLGDARQWKAVPRRFGPDQDGLQSYRSSDGRALQHLYVETFATGPTKPFVISDLDIGASRTGTCRAAP